MTNNRSGARLFDLRLCDSGLRRCRNSAGIDCELRILIFIDALASQLALSCFSKRNELALTGYCPFRFKELAQLQLNSNKGTN